MTTHRPTIQVECYVRQSALVEPVDTTITSLKALAAEGVIDDLTIEGWPAEVALSDSSPQSDVVETYEQFGSWAEQWNVSLQPAFSRRSHSYQIIEKEVDVLITPVQCLAVYVAGALREVFPHRTDGGETYTVPDAIGLLEEGDHLAQSAAGGPGLPHHPAESNRSTPASLASDHCPTCDTQYVSGQGVYSCPDCGWVGIATERGKFEGSYGSRSDEEARGIASAGEAK